LLGNAASKQKAEVLRILREDHGIELKQFRAPLDNVGAVKTFLRAHEQSHIDNKDSYAGFWDKDKSKEENYMHPDALAMEVRATLDGLKAIEDYTGEIQIEDEFAATEGPTEEVAAEMTDEEVAAIMDPLFRDENTPAINEQVTQSDYADIPEAQKVKEEDMRPENRDHNVIKEFFKAFKGSVVLNTSKHFTALIKTLNSNMRLMNYLPGFEKYANKKLAQAHRVIRSSEKINDKFQAAAVKLFKGKLENRFKDNIDRKGNSDPVQFLSRTNKDGEAVLPANVVAMMAASAHKYVATKGTASLNNDYDNIRGILNLRDGIALSPLSSELLARVGVAGNAIVWELGMEAYKLLGIEQDGKYKANTDADFEDRLIVALGTMTLSMMQETGMVKETIVHTGRTRRFEKQGGKTLLLDDDYSSNGLEGLAQFESDETMDDGSNEAQVYMETAANSIRENFILETPTDTVTNWNGDKARAVPTYFYRLATEEVEGQEQPTADNREYIEAYHESPHTWDVFYKGEANPKTYSWEKPSAAKRILQKGLNAVSKRNENLDIYEQEGWVPNYPVMTVFLSLPESMQRDILGAEVASEKMKIREDSVEGVNREIDRRLAAVQAWLKDALAQEGNEKLDKPFYIPNFFTKSTRMMQSGDINPQGSKYHRSMFNMQSWAKNKGFIPSEDMSQEEKLFILAVGLTLDIEVAKTKSDHFDN
jgi:hypothetical protein